MTGTAGARPEALFGRLDAALEGEGVEVELCVVGGAVLTLTFVADPGTRRPGALMADRESALTARRAAADRGKVPLDRLDEAVRTFAVPGPDRVGSVYEGRHLRVFAAPADYVLAMKCAALRYAPDPGVEDDIRYLLRYQGLSSVEPAMGVVDQYLNARQRPLDLSERLEALLA